MDNIEGKVTISLADYEMLRNYQEICTETQKELEKKDKLIRSLFNIKHDDTIGINDLIVNYDAAKDLLNLKGEFDSIMFFKPGKGFPQRFSADPMNMRL